MRSTLPLLALAAFAGAADLPREMQIVNQQPVPVSAKQELTIKARNDQDVRNRELWYSQFDGSAWGNWQKHGLNFARDTPITWSPPEGHWQIYVRIEEVSGMTMPAPGADTAPSSQFIIDRTPPAVAVTFPAEGAHLRGGADYKITWNVADLHLHSTPVTIRWSRSGDDQYVVIAENIPNSGEFTWTTPRDMTANGRLQVLAADKAGNIGSSANGNITIDAVAPSRNILGPAISASRDISLAIRTQDAGPSGIAAVRLWFSNDDGANWNAGPELTSEPFESVPWRAPSDGLFQLYLVATDRAGNANAEPKGAAASQFRVLVDTESPTLSLAAAIGIVDPQKAADAPVRRIFKPGDRVNVQFSVQDPNVRADGISVLFQPQQGGRWEVVAKGLAPDQPYVFTIPNIATTSARIKVQAVDVAGNQGEVTGAETFSIDNQVETGAVDVEL